MRDIRPQNWLSSQSPALRARAGVVGRVRSGANAPDKGLSLSGNANASVAMIKLLPPTRVRRCASFQIFAAKRFVQSNARAMDLLRSDREREHPEGG
jgi:hypothetical protein